jgi:hypothetical protein
VAVRAEALDEVLHERLVLVIGGPDEEVRLGAHERRERTPVLLDDPIDEHLRVEPALLRDPEHLRRMLVRPREEEGVVAPLPMMADEDVGRDRRVRVADVRRRVDVVDRCRQIEGAHRDQ